MLLCVFFGAHINDKTIFHSGTHIFSICVCLSRSILLLLCSKLFSSGALFLSLFFLLFNSSLTSPLSSFFSFSRFCTQFLSFSLSFSLYHSLSLAFLRRQRTLSLWPLFLISPHSSLSMLFFLLYLLCPPCPSLSILHLIRT